MQAADFVRKWSAGGVADALGERAGARTDGFADVWLRGHFAWEYKAPGAHLGPTLRQLMMYALPLESPPLLVVSDRRTLEIHTHFTGTPSEKHVVRLDELTRPEVQQLLRRLWTDPESFRPRRSNREITEAAARTFAATARRLHDAGLAAERVSHFLTRMGNLFSCCFESGTNMRTPAQAGANHSGTPGGGADPLVSETNRCQYP